MSFSVTIQRNELFPVIILKEDTTGTEAEVYTLGGILNSFRIPIHKRVQNMVDGFTSVEDAKKNMVNGFKSAKLSPFVCRLRDGNFRLRGSSYHINKFYLGDHAIHGLVYDAVFNILSFEQNENFAKVTLVYRYEGTDKGYPFPYEMEVSWLLEKENKLTVATTLLHHNEEPLPFADGWHPYFTLGDTIDDCTLQFSSNRKMEFDQDLLPTGNFLEDDRFVNGCQLKDITLDNAFAFSKEDPNPFCRLSNKHLALSIKPDNAYPILQIYTPENRKSIAIENLSGAPDNFNNEIGLVMLAPNVSKIFTTSYQVTVL